MRHRLVTVPAPAPRRSRAESTSERRQDILDAALECFSTMGYEQTTLADIRERAGASTGSIYHHFGSKERIAAALYLDGLRQTQDAGMEALLRTRTARTGITALVAAYIDWVVAHPAFASFSSACGTRRSSTRRSGRSASSTSPSTSRLAAGSRSGRSRRAAAARAGHALRARVRPVPPVERIVAARHDLHHT
jgi:AcrR family transcriptional regulator